jgi:hypothetical protein
MLSGQVLDLARTHLNDDQGLLWQDPKLFPKYQQAYRALLLEMQLVGLPLFLEQTVPITVTAGTTDFSTVSGYPTDMVIPLWMKEALPGQQLLENFIDMVPVDFIPNVDQDVRLIWWAWIGGKILFLGALNDVIVQLRYRSTLTVPTSNSQDTNIPGSEIYLGYQTAGFAYQSVQGGSQQAEAMFKAADIYLDKFIRFAIKGQQRLPAKRRAYHRRYAWGNIIRGM